MNTTVKTIKLLLRDGSELLMESTLYHDIIDASKGVDGHRDGHRDGHGDGDGHSRPQKTVIGHSRLQKTVIWVTEAERRVIDVLREFPSGISVVDVASLLDDKPQNVSLKIRSLLKDDPRPAIAERIGSTWRYRLTPQAAESSAIFKVDTHPTRKYRSPVGG